MVHYLDARTGWSIALQGKNTVTGTVITSILIELIVFRILTKKAKIRFMIIFNLFSP